MAPAMIALQVGSIIGHLARRTLGQYELPLPRALSDEIVVVASNVAAFAADWSLELDDVTMWLAAHDLAAHAVLSRPHVHERLRALLVAHAASFRPDLSALEERFGEAALGEVGDVGDLGRLLGDPAALAEPVDTPELRRVHAELAALTSALAGYVEWVTDCVATRLIGERRPVAEALRRRRVERSDDERAAEALFGLRLDQDALDRGEAFVRGVVERGGDAELGKLWVSEANLPTPAEVDAPGLWIRVGQPASRRRRLSRPGPQDSPGAGSSGMPRSHSSSRFSRSASRTTRSRLRRNCGSCGGSSTRRASARSRNASITGRSPNSDSISQWGATGPR